MVLAIRYNVVLPNGRQVAPGSFRVRTGAWGAHGAGIQEGAPPMMRPKRAPVGCDLGCAGLC